MTSDAFPHKHLLSVSQLKLHEVQTIFQTAESFLEISRRPVRKVPSLRGKTVINLFYEASTRTRTSFELAGKRLSADVINISTSTSSTKKGETLLDTCRTLEAMHPDIVVLRHGASGAPEFVASKVGFSVINAGDGMHAHPTQALLDVFSLSMAFGKTQGLRVAICGDILHSRVARSLCTLLQLMGNEVRIAAPRTLLPAAPESLGAAVFDTLEDAVEGAHAIVLLRIQQERLRGSFVPSLREYAKHFCLTPERLSLAAQGARVMHPGPINRGVEIDSKLADSEHSLILNQVESGLAIRMALLYLLAGSRES